MTQEQEKIVAEIKQLQKEKNAIILGHYYVRDEVQEIADYVGDSYYLSQVATETDADVIVFAGVSFMAESAKLLNPEKTVLHPDTLSDCPMAHMADVATIEKMRQEYEDLAVVCYINSTGELKAHSDVCVTSSNALKIVSLLPNKNIFFIPDENLGRYIASKLPEKNFIFNPGYCHVHKSITLENVLEAKKAKPNVKMLAHPECRLEVLEQADFIGSTKAIIEYARTHEDKEFLICTELGVLYQMRKENPDKKFYSVGHRQYCPNMKRITLENVRDVLRDNLNEVFVTEEFRKAANAPLEKMLELAAK